MIPNARNDPPSRSLGIQSFLARPAGTPVIIILAICILAAPVWLFADSLRYSRMILDDFAYAGASRSFSKTMTNLFVPHNAHIVPAWRLLTWAIVAASGNLATLPANFGRAAIAVVPLVMLETGILVGRETRSTSAGLVAMAASGTTSILRMPATWYSAGQTFWAGLGILLTLLALQSWRRSGGAWRLGLAAVWAVIAGGFWTIGHLAGPAGCVYLLADGRSSARRAAVVPILATVVAVAVSFAMGARKIEVDIKFEGTDRDKAINFTRGASHTLQSISETLVIGNLGVAAETQPVQAAVLSLSLLGLWLWTFRNGGRPSPLEWAGGVILLGAYFISWSFRGYYTFENLRNVVPWYDTIPHLGAVLFASGWWSRVWQVQGAEPARLSRGGAFGIVVVALGLVAIHQPRATVLFVKEAPKMTAAELKKLPILELQRLRAVAYREVISQWQRDHLYRLDRAERVAQKAGIGLDLIHQTFGRVLAPILPEAYDAAELLNLPRKGTETNPERARELLGPLFRLEPEPKLSL